MPLNYSVVPFPKALSCEIQAVTPIINKESANLARPDFIKIKKISASPSIPIVKPMTKLMATVCLVIPALVSWKEPVSQVFRIKASLTPTVINSTVILALSARLGITSTNRTNVQEPIQIALLSMIKMEIAQAVTQALLFQQENASDKPQNRST